MRIHLLIMDALLDLLRLGCQVELGLRIRLLRIQPELEQTGLR
jgi:hypothetical protein